MNKEETTELSSFYVLSYIGFQRNYPKDREFPKGLLGNCNPPPFIFRAKKLFKVLFISKFGSSVPKSLQSASKANSCDVTHKIMKSQMTHKRINATVIVNKNLSRDLTQVILQKHK